MVLFDPDAKPLPEIPFPNNLATRPDASSPTGRRINASLIAPTNLEATVRAKMDRLDGFGTLQAITVAFDQPLDPGEIIRRHHGDHDFTNDAVLLIDVTPESPDFGQARPLDMGRGNFPLTLKKTDRYFDSDPRDMASNVLFETEEEDLNGNGVLDPGEDTDFDGVLDHPNVYPPGADPLDGLMTFYESETHTLIMRPVLPLREQNTYAVVLTNRLRGVDGRSVRSPWAWVHHLQQTAALDPLGTALSQLGMSWSDVAYAWTFTTQSVTKDLVAIREGLQGIGPLAWLEEAYPPEALPDPCMNDDSEGSLYVLGADSLIEVARILGPEVFGGNLDEVEPLLATYDHVDYLVSGSFESPDFLRTADAPAPHTENFVLDLSKGTAAHLPARLRFTAVVPKTTARFQPPFPVIFYAHGYSSTRSEVLGFAGTMARYGIASVAIDAWGHGLPIDPELVELVMVIADGWGFGPFADTLLMDRGRDLDGDGTIDSGGDFWTAYGFHTRDVVRQTISDYFQLVRVVRGWDAQRTWAVDQNGDGADDLAGDFNGDGVVDFGGPDVPGFTWGESMGGIHSSILGPLEPSIIAAAPTAGGAGLSDVGVRTMLSAVERAVMLRTMGPLVIGEPTGESEMTLRLVVPLGNERQRMTIGSVAGIAEGDEVLVTNLSKDEVHQSRVTSDLRFRVSMAADRGDAFEVAVHDGETGALIAVFDTWSKDQHYYSTEDPTVLAGDPLLTPTEGYGLARCTPDLRRMVGLLQMVLDPADPANYARHYFAEPLDIQPEGARVTNLLEIICLGDQDVPVNTQMTLARAAGLLELSQPDPRYGMSVNDWLIENHVVEGLAGIGRFPAPDYLFDPDNLDESSDGWDAPEPETGQELRVKVNTPTGVSGVRFAYMHPRGQHGFFLPSPQKDFDMDSYMANLVGTFFASLGTQIIDDVCLTTASCGL